MENKSLQLGKALLQQKYIPVEASRKSFATWVNGALLYEHPSSPCPCAESAQDRGATSAVRVLLQSSGLST